ncbi:MAG: HD domain-containing phosphohydrolase [Candidatus Eremiobacterota bacterium]
MFKSFRVKLFIIFLLTTIAVSGSTIYFIYRIAVNVQFEALRKAVLAIASTTALMIEPEEFKKIDPNNPVFSEPFKKYNNLLHKVLENNPDIRYAYTLVETEDPNICNFAADSEYFNRDVMTEQDKKEINYDVSKIPELRDKVAFIKPVTTKHYYNDRWGTWLTGYAPVRDKNGKTLAVVAIDMSASKISSFQQYLTLWSILIFILDLIISVILSALVSSTISLPILKIAEHTKEISEGNFKSRIDIKSEDEIKKLADSFNTMVDKLDHMFLDLAKTQSDLKVAHLDTIFRLALAAEYKDEVTSQHLKRVSVYSRIIAEKYGLSEEDLDNIEIGAPLHDIGKIGIPDNILLKTEKLTAEEYEIIKKHPSIGYEILKESRSPYLKTAALICLKHHEYFDGTGYPNGLKGEDIHIYGRIVALADVFDALTSKRSYKEPFSIEKTVEMIKSKSGTQFDPKVVDAFLESLHEIKKYIKFFEESPV